MAMRMTDDFVRLESGIPGLDEMMEGGIPFPSMTLLAGGTGTGKTTFALQFLFQGARNDETGLFFTTLSEPTQWMLRFSSRYSFVDKQALGSTIKYVELGSMIREIDSYEPLLDLIEDWIAKEMPQRVVIDPVTVLSSILEPRKYRLFLYDLATKLKNWQIISVLTGEAGFQEPYPFEVAHTADNVLILSNIEREDGRQKYLEILKMRGTEHMTGKHAVDISTDGFLVQPGLH